MAFPEFPNIYIVLINNSKDRTSCHSKLIWCLRGRVVCVWGGGGGVRRGGGGVMFCGRGLSRIYIVLINNSKDVVL